ncbi:IclR family transcriptional regulator [Actinomadura physcomitrii]|uniref:IclR family transcriptional regulator n=1 Tax=Actinomadura physcomitrii TaxID=2650748 RepID=UPI00136C0615|nr:IclR family transcriptional regulator [Actinomadura physcomitrii]
MSDADLKGSSLSVNRVRSVDRALEILTCFSSAHPRLTLTELAQGAGLSKATTLRIAGSLLAYGFLRRDDDGSYRLGARLLELAPVVAQGSPVALVTERIVARLAERTGETVLAAEIDWRDRSLVITQRRDAAHVLGVLSPVGRRSLIANGCIGKAALASLPRDQVVELMPTLRLPRRTGRSITEYDAFLAEIDRAREHGYSVESGEFAPGVAGASVVVMAQGKAAGAVAVVAPVSRCGARRLAAIGELVRECVSHAGAGR